MIDSCYRLREKADYDDFYLVARDEAVQQIEKARLLLRSVDEYLTQLNTYYTTGLKMLEHSQTYAYQILGDASAVNMLPATDSNAPAPLFDLQGRRIARPAGKGVYICKGKKIIQ